MLLSICIPSYNHAAELRRVLENFLSLPSFVSSDEIEVVVSDNASTDGTDGMCRQIVERSHGRIRYFRNESNVHDENFALALGRGRGLFRKLANDTLIFSESGLRQMLDAIRAHSEKQPILFFLNGGEGPSEIACDSLDAFFRQVSFHSTWIGSFGIWADDLAKVPDFARAAPLQLTQVDVLCRLLQLKNHSVVFSFPFARSIPRGRVGGYDLAVVFGRNYFTILRPYLATGELTRRTFRLEKHRMLRRHLLPFYLSLNEQFAFPKTGFAKALFSNYWSFPLFWISLPFVAAAAALTAFRHFAEHLFMLMGEFLRIAPHFYNWFLWKRRNRHNRTSPVNVFDRCKVDVGKGTYGGLEVYFYGSPGEHLSIGNWVSIGPNVRFMAGGEHRTDTVSTFPFDATYGTKAVEAVTKGPIVVGDDVWIGCGATILSGVTIGQGAVIAAGAVVTKDVEPYTLVGGVPARTIRSRFEKPLRDKLMTLDLSTFDPSRVGALHDILSEKLTEENVDWVLSALRTNAAQ